MKKSVPSFHETKTHEKKNVALCRSRAMSASIPKTIVIYCHLLSIDIEFLIKTSFFSTLILRRLRWSNNPLYVIFLLILFLFFYPFLFIIAYFYAY